MHHDQSREVVIALVVVLSVGGYSHTCVFEYTQEDPNRRIHMHSCLQFQKRIPNTMNSKHSFQDSTARARVSDASGIPCGKKLSGRPALLIQTGTRFPIQTDRLPVHADGFLAGPGDSLENFQDTKAWETSIVKSRSRGKFDCELILVAVHQAKFGTRCHWPRRLHVLLRALHTHAPEPAHFSQCPRHTGEINRAWKENIAMRRS